MNALEIDFNTAFSRRIVLATSTLFGDQPIAHRVRELCKEYERHCHDIVTGRGVPMLTLAIVGSKGQGKTWLARQMILDPMVQQQLKSGVLTSEATTKMHWVGSAAPEDLDQRREVFHFCESNGLLDLGQPYMLLDTPGTTDTDKAAADIAQQALGLAPIKLLVMRRDQSRSAINSQIAVLIEGAICIPIITCVPAKEMSASGSVQSKALESDIRQLCDLLRASAPQTKLLEPILIEDFDASGDEPTAGRRVAQQLVDRLRGEPLEALAQTRANRLSAATARLRRNVSRTVDTDAPQLAASVRRLHEEAEKLPEQVIQSVLGSPIVLQTAVRGRMRAQLITDTSQLWFPYRAVLSLLSLTQGAWDRLILALSGSVPSIFGTLAAWARNVQTSRKISWEMHEGIRDRLNRQIEDRLEPINRQFQLALHRFKTADDDARIPKELPKVRLGGIEALQSQSRALFESIVDRYATSGLLLQLAGLVSIIVFWALLAGPIVSVYREYLSASYDSLTSGTNSVETFPHPSPSLIFTSVLLSIIPIFLFAMTVMTFFLRRTKIGRISQQILAGHHGLVEQLKRDGVLRLHYEDSMLEHAEFLIHLDRS